ncbi:MAG: hypothetical protein JXD22_09645 [Sedimentisphaerales bacterium]|nr:hypothetical protein [Sedimentisphaerales bacterium]
MNPNQWINTTENICETYGKILSESEKQILLKKIDVPSYPKQSDNIMVRMGNIPLEDNVMMAHESFFSELYDILTKAFFEKVLNKDAFGDEAKVNEIFGKTLQENYGVYNGPFLDLARTYWTFKIEVMELFAPHSDKFNLVISQFLISYIMEIGGCFFPTPGPFKYPYKDRIRAQEMYFEIYAPNFDKKTYFKNNPVLNKLKSEEAKWPGIVYILIFLVIAWFIPQNVWWGKILFYILMGLIVISLCCISDTIKTLIFGKKINPHPPLKKRKR